MAHLTILSRGLHAYAFGCGLEHNNTNIIPLPSSSWFHVFNIMSDCSFRSESIQVSLTKCPLLFICFCDLWSFQVTLFDIQGT